MTDKLLSLSDYLSLHLEVFLRRPRLRCLASYVSQLAKARGIQIVKKELEQPEGWTVNLYPIQFLREAIEQWESEGNGFSLEEAGWRSTGLPKYMEGAKVSQPNTQGIR